MPKKKKTSGKKSADTKPAGAETRAANAETFPIVGLGASAGGLEALKAFFSEVGETSGMAYVVVVHMAPKQPSMMAQLIGNVARIPVAPAEDGQAIEPNRAYIIPPDAEISIFKGKIQLMSPAAKGRFLSIDLFLRSLARDQGRRAAAVILSGTGTDGTLGAKEIKANEGLVVAQSEESAGYDGMPRSVIAAGIVDMILPPQEMPENLVRYFTHPRTALREDATATTTEKEQRGWLNKIFAILRSRTGHDFSSYKVNTILRRIDRRMGLNGIDAHETYVRFMRENPKEVETLFRELLIGVTRFFRDPASFEALEKTVLPGLFAGMAEDGVFRAWIPGCSTGEEVYSLAIVLREALERTDGRINLQIFGTDIDDHAVDKARSGLFPANIAADMTPERLKRFFTKEGDFFRIRKEIRDCAVFSVQNLLRDPPFSHLNLLCCRNVLIYLDAAAQKKLLPLFHYTLRPGGVLVLGSSETIGGFTRLFEPLDAKWKIFRRREVPPALRQFVDFPSGSSAAPTFAAAASGDNAAYNDVNIARAAQKAILDEFAPTALLVDGKGDILHVQGRTGKYLETPGGPPTHNILDLAREGLRIELSSALRAAGTSDAMITRKNIMVKTNGGVQPVNLRVCRRDAPKALAGRFLVAFEDVEAPPAPDGEQDGEQDGDQSAESRSARENSRTATLERELQDTRESRQAAVEELESANEELKSTNEELQSGNEELQSTNEELESSKEELQSLNEELQTVNAELENKVSELSATHDDMRNLLNSTEIATIFVDNDLRVRRFTSEAVHIVNLIHTDIGRPLGHVVCNLRYDGLLADLAGVIKNLTPKEAEVRTASGDWYKMRIMPYRTMDNRIDGAVLTFAAIDEQKKAQVDLKVAARDIERTRDLVRAVFDMNTEPMAVLDAKERIVIANTGFSDLMNIPPEKIKGADFYAIQKGAVQKADMRAALKAALDDGTEFETPPVDITNPEGGRTYVIRGRIIQQEADSPYRILLQYVQKGIKGEAP